LWNTGLLTTHAYIIIIEYSIKKEKKLKEYGACDMLIYFCKYIRKASKETIKFDMVFENFK
jgi:hypothetical protein